MMTIRPTHRCIHATADRSMPRRCAGNPKVHPVHNGTKLTTARLAARRCTGAQDPARKTSGRMFTVSRSATIEPCWTVAISRWPNSLGRGYPRSRRICITCHRIAHRPQRDARRHTSQLPRTIATQIPYQSVCDMWEIRSYQGDVVGGMLQVSVDVLGSGGVFVSPECHLSPHLDACSRMWDRATRWVSMVNLARLHPSADLHQQHDGLVLGK